MIKVLMACHGNAGESEKCARNAESCEHQRESFRTNLGQNWVRNVVWREKYIEVGENVNICRLLFGKVLK